MAPRKAKTTKLEKALASIFYNPRAPGSYGGVTVLHQSVDKGLKPKRPKVVKWLSTQDTYTLHKPVKRKFKRSRVVVNGMDDQWQADLVDVSSMSQKNRGTRYLLTCIDVLSKFAWVVQLKDKTGKSLVKAFKTILESGRKPNRLQCDKGTEFINKSFQQLLKDEGIDFFTTHNEETKASIVERFNRTLKGRMWKHFTRNDSKVYWNILQDLVWSYNHTRHGSIGTQPVLVTRENQEDIWQKLYGDMAPPKKPASYRVGDSVRISKAKKTFKKGYLPNWSEELFTVVKVKPTSPVRYLLADEKGEVLAGSFYSEELEKVVKANKVYRIESIWTRELKARSNRCW